MDATDDLRESIPPKDPIEQVEGLRVELPLPGVSNIGTLLLLAAMAAPCQIFNQLQQVIKIKLTQIIS